VTPQDMPDDTQDAKAQKLAAARKKVRSHGHSHLFCSCDVDTSHILAY